MCGCQSWKPTSKELDRLDKKTQIIFQNVASQRLSEKKKSKEYGLDDETKDGEEETDIDFSYVVNNIKLLKITRQTDLF